ncbi:MAG: hypothetical protein ACRBCT_04930 [Alphaproteobacteria bacterium]
MENIIIYLLGFPGTGKLTIAKEICAQADVRLVDNHLVCNPVFSLIESDGKAPLPERVWSNVAKIREVVFDTMVNLSPADRSFVLTNVLTQNDKDDAIIFEKMLCAVRARKAKFLPVRLLIDEQENLTRVISPERKLNMKYIGPEGLLRVRKDNAVFQSGHENELSLDVTDLPAKEAARIILGHVAAC